jgi:hypothetical protein
VVVPRRFRAFGEPVRRGYVQARSSAGTGSPFDIERALRHVARRRPRRSVNVEGGHRHHPRLNLGTAAGGIAAAVAQKGTSGTMYECVRAGPVRLAGSIRDDDSLPEP